MSRFLNFFAIEEFYHIYNRGIEKRKIFMDYKDEHRFLMLLYTCNTEEKIHLSDFKNKSLNEILEIKRNETLVDIGAYCLMTNHFHILIREKKENGISIFMQKVLTAYTMYFNKSTIDQVLFFRVPLRQSIVMIIIT